METILNLLSGIDSAASLLAGLISGGLTVPLVSWLLNWIAARRPAFDKTAKRRTAIVASFALGTGAFLLSVWLGYSPSPGETLRAWIEAMWPVWTVAFTVSQVVLSEYKAAVEPGTGSLR